MNQFKKLSVYALHRNKYSLSLQKNEDDSISNEIYKIKNQFAKNYLGRRFFDHILNLSCFL